MNPEAIKQAFETCLQNAREAFEKGNYGTCGGFLELGIPILFGQGLRGGFLRQINEILMRDGAKIDFERIVSCVNAMEGLNPEGIKELIRCAETVVKSPKHDLSDKIIDLKSALAKVIP